MVLSHQARVRIPLGLPIDTCLALLGYRGAGKSTLGARLAEGLRRPFFDLDREIEMAQGRTIAALFRDEGEAAFRRIEAETLDGIVARGLLARPGIVLAPGGGIVETPANRALLRTRCCAIYLDVPAAVLLARLEGQAAHGAERPRLTALPLAEEVRTVLARRDPLYRECARHVLTIAAAESVDDTIRRVRGLFAAS